MLTAFLLFVLLPARSSTQGSAPVCFWSDGGLACIERAPGMGVAGLPDARSALEALLAGPTPQEQAQGLWSAIPSGTTLAGVDVGPDLTVVVRLDVPPEALRPLDPMTLEIIVEQIGGTLEPLHWRDLRIQTRDPETGAFVPLADFLPEMPTPRKPGIRILGLAPTPPSPLSLWEGGIGARESWGEASPQGALSGKTVYVSAGHGWEWTGSAWRVQRIPYPRPPYVGPIIEDFNNAEAVNQYLLQYLWNAGARVFPVRERDMNQAEVLVDNDASPPGTGYSESGAWSSASGGYRGLTYRYATTVVGAPTATTTWSATIPADGRYAVYVWYRQESSRAPDARYIVRHAGGETTVVVNQRLHGNTWHYLGTYGFLAGQEARVTLTNQSNFAGQAVIADAVRFGGGFFDDPDLSGIQTTAPYAPNRPWWEIAAFYQVQRMGMDPDDWPYFNDIVARPMYARWEHAGTGEDAVYVSWHTNGASGTTRGTMSIVHNGEGNQVTPGSAALRDAIHAELVGDIRAGWDPTWPEYTRSMNLGELRELWDSDPGVRMPGALIEIAYHDHPSDADALKEPSFEMLAARAVYQGIVKYFEQRDGIDLTLLPEPPTHLAVQNVGGGQVRVSWFPPPVDGLGGDAATGYRVYTSTNGIGWSNGVDVATTAYTLTGLAPGQLLFVRVTATNAGGESFPTETLAVRVGNEPDVLLVNGFDRLNRGMLVPETYAPTNETHLRMLLDRMNRYDYTIQHGEVISYPFDSASNEAVQAGLVRLSDYVLVDWILGEESTQDETLSATEQALLADFMDSGGALFISGSEIGWDLDLYGSESDRAFYNTYLRADYAGDDAATYTVAPAAGSIFEGLASFHFDAPGMYDADYPDQLIPSNGSTAALSYTGGTGGAAAVQHADGCRRLVYFGFPFETIRPEERPAVMGRVLDFIDFCRCDTHITNPSDNTAFNTVPLFAGTAETRRGEVQRVEVQVQRKSDGQYWAGSIWHAGETWLTASGTEKWSYDLSPALNSDGSYVLRARAWTTTGISDTTPAEVTFTYDTGSPGSTILITPTGGISITAVLARLEWQPLPPDGGAPLGYAVRLDDRFYRTAQSVLTVPIPEGLHTWGVQVFDAAGNRSAWVTDTFSVRQYHTWLPLVMRNFAQTPPVCPDVIVNGGFEADWATEQSHRCLVLPEGAAPYMTDIGNIFTPPGWTTWFRHQPDTWDQPEARDAHLSIDPRRVHSGQKAMLLFTFYRKHDAGFLQQVQVTPGARLRLTAWAHAWSNSHGGPHPDDGRWSEGPGYDCGFELEGTPDLNSDWRNFTFRLGIDPTGGTNPFAGTVVWGQGAHIYNCHSQVPAVETTAQAETVTVFLRSTTLWPFKHNDAYWDDVRLEVCP